MGVSQSIPMAPGSGKKALEAAGYDTTRKPLRLNLQRQYMLKEYLQLHGGYGPHVTLRVSDNENGFRLFICFFQLVFVR